YCSRFKDAWEAAQYAADHLDRLESRTRAFAQAFAESTLPAAVKDAASANLSTLASTVCFRTADGEFHGFEGASDHLGCCFGNCTHVWNYETATAHLFPSYARSLRHAAFGYSMDEEGGMRFRQLLPDGKERFNTAAADGQMGQILHAYMDWKLSGDTQWLKAIWPRIRKAIEFAWIRNGWDPGRTGVLTGVQHNTYDIEFFGPNPFCSVYYLGALHATEEMAHAVGDDAAASLYRSIFEKGSRWVDEHLFQGEFYIQQIRGYGTDEIASQLRAGMGGEDTKDPQFQVGSGCLADQLIGQYLAAVAGLDTLVSPLNIRTTMESIYRYNYKSTLVDHECVQRTYALNEEGAVMVCDYGKGERPRVPFPYFAEAWTGTEYLVASLLFYVGMIEEGIHVVSTARARYDGRKRNPWDEEECGHHYARAMSSWSTIVMLSGFHYAGDRAALTIMPRLPARPFRSFWSTGTGWGTFSLEGQANGMMLKIHVISGKLPCGSCIVAGPATQAWLRFGTKTYPLRVEQEDQRIELRFPETLTIPEGMRIEIEVKA
ncbi:MAG TPA: GH116 family glycosyl hydrolase, partial [Edaphobacter sp.]|nr:GH116 family glycosyl hydrolase [Edaphobacter sp.]